MDSSSRLRDDTTARSCTYVSAVDGSNLGSHLNTRQCSLDGAGTFFQKLFYRRPLKCINLDAEVSNTISPAAQFIVLSLPLCLA